MPTNTILVDNKTVATQLVSAGDGPTLVFNNGPNTLWVGDDNTIQWDDGSGVIPVPAGSTYSVDGQSDHFGTAEPGSPTTVYTILGGQTFFQPLSSFTVGIAPNTQIQLLSAGGVGQLLFLLNNALYGNGLMESAILSGFAQILLNGPKLLSVPDFVGMEANSNNGSGGTANFQWDYTDANGVTHTYMALYAGGVDILAGNITAVEPGTGTSDTNAAQAESAHSLSITGSGWSGSVTYELLADDMVVIQGSVVTPSSGSYNDVAFASLPSGYIPGTTQNRPCVPLAGSTYGNATFPGAPHLIISSGSGNLLLWGIPGSLNGQSVDISCTFHL
jgi:hypothetical protein